MLQQQCPHYLLFWSAPFIYQQPYGKRCSSKLRTTRRAFPSGWRLDHVRRGDIESVPLFVQPASLPPIPPRRRMDSSPRCPDVHSWPPDCLDHWRLPTGTGASNRGPLHEAASYNSQATRRHLPKRFDLFPISLCTSDTTDCKRIWTVDLNEWK